MKPPYSLIGLAVCFSLVVALPFIDRALHAKAQAAAPLDAVVYIEDASGGHGSGVHLGRGLILTARHVVIDRKGDFETNITVRDAGGFKSDAKVLWTSPEFDTALLQTTYAGPAATLRCTTVGMGEGIAAAGSPGDLSFITTYGHAAGAGPMSVEGPTGPVEVTVMDLNGGKGMSGGPIFDAHHRVVGIMSMITNPKNLVGSFAFAIPATNICRLLAR